MMNLLRIQMPRIDLLHYWPSFAEFQVEIGIVLGPQLQLCSTLKRQEAEEEMAWHQKDLVFASWEQLGT